MVASRGQRYDHLLNDRTGTDLPNFAANLSMMYTEHDFLDRFAAAAKDGFTAVEFLFPYDFQASEIRSALDGAGLRQVLFNAPPGRWADNERGICSLPGREQEFLDGVDMAIEYALALQCPRVHLMAGLCPNPADRPARWVKYLENLALAAAKLQSAELNGLLEPINPRDIPGFLVNTQGHALAAIAAVGASNLKVQMDLYHCQIVEGDLAVKIRENLSSVDHIQIAGVPDRHEPDFGEVNYPYLFDLIDSLGFTGSIGCEYRPRGETSAGLGWFAPYREAQRKS